MSISDQVKHFKPKNELLKSAKSLYKSSKKSRELNREVSLIEESISAQLDKIEQAYMQLGQAYLLKHPKDYDADYQIYVNQILDAKEIIDAFNEKLRKIKGLRICPECGQEIVYDAKFCNYCGAKLEPLSSEQLFKLLEKQRSEEKDLFDIQSEDDLFAIEPRAEEPTSEEELESDPLVSIAQKLKEKTYTSSTISSETQKSDLDHNEAESSARD